MAEPICIVSGKWRTLGQSYIWQNLYVLCLGSGGHWGKMTYYGSYICHDLCIVPITICSTVILALQMYGH